MSRLVVLPTVALLLLAGCDSTPALKPRTEIPFRAFDGVYLVTPPFVPNASARFSDGAFVFRTQAEWDAASPDRRDAVDLRDSVVVAYAYEWLNNCASGGTISRIVRVGDRAAVELAPLRLPVPICLAERPFQSLAVIARKDLPDEIEVSFRGPEVIEIRDPGIE